MIHIDVDFSYFALCSVLCREGLWSTLVYLGGFSVYVVICVNFFFAVNACNKKIV